LEAAEDARIMRQLEASDNAGTTNNASDDAGTTNNIEEVHHVGTLMKIFAYCKQTSQYLIWTRKEIDNGHEGSSDPEDKLWWVKIDHFPDKICKHKAEGEKLKTLAAIRKRKRAGVQLMLAHDKYAQAKACMELRIAKMNFEKIQSKLVRESGGVMTTERKLKVRLSFDDLLYCVYNQCCLRVDIKLMVVKINQLSDVTNQKIPL
jgi:hypothetical protein